MTGILLFAGAAAILTVTPGADTALLIRNAMARGRRAGFATVSGNLCGLIVHLALSVLGLSAILVHSAAAFEFVRLAGAAYLIFLGLQSIFAPSANRSPKEEATGKSGRSYLEGLLTNVLNPKTAFFYLAMLPQFIGPADDVLRMSLLLGGIHIAMAAVWKSLLVVCLARFPHASFPKRLDRLFGAVLTGLGIRLAFGDR